ncbi:MAG: trimeric intracellular cation channel family protein [Desulfotalea sp.]
MLLPYECKMDPVVLLTTLFITGLIVESMTGAIAAGEHEMDLFGVIVVANVTAFGGGVIRDILLGNAPMLIITKPELLFLTSIAALLMVLIARYFRKLKWLFLGLDALGLITFSIVGAMRAQEMGFGPGVASIAGITTGVFGGILRDMICNQIPLAFQKELYASVSIASVWLYLGLRELGAPATVSVPVTLALGFCLRILAIKYDWRIPKFIYKANY